MKVNYHFFRENMLVIFFFDSFFGSTAVGVVVVGRCLEKTARSGCFYNEEVIDCLGLAICMASVGGTITHSLSSGMG